MKEMVGGCCVCSDERGWPDNPLVYCDGNGCTVAVHQACYGIVTVPTGPWYCRKCENPDTKGKVRCELCPSKSGALKRSDTGGWAHVVCALYIPEVRFGNVTSMEPIVLRLIPAERYNKTCYICQEQGKSHRASAGACMQCNKSGCKQQFHVTCAQSLGLLCEEAGNYLDNVKYCGYCQHHYSKLKKGGNVKTIPPYKPVSHDSQSSDSSGEKEGDHSPKTGGGTPTHKSKGSGRKSSHTSGTSSGKNTPNASKTPTTQSNMETTGEEVTPAGRKHRSDKNKSRKSSPSRRGSATGEAGSASGSKANTPAPSPQHNTDVAAPHGTGKGVPESKVAPPASSPGAKSSESSVINAATAPNATSSAAGSSMSTSVVQTTGAKSSPYSQESVITNVTDSIENKHTKKRKAATAANSATNPGDYASHQSPSLLGDSASGKWDNTGLGDASADGDKIVKKAKTDNSDNMSQFANLPLPPPPSASPASHPSPRHLPSPMPGPSGLSAVPNIRSPSQPPGKSSGDGPSLLVSVPLSVTSHVLNLALNAQMPAGHNDNRGPSPLIFHQVQKQAAMEPAHSPHAVGSRSSWGGLNVSYEMQQPTHTAVGPPSGGSSKDPSHANTGGVRNKKRAAMATSVVSMANTPPAIQSPGAQSLASVRRPPQPTPPPIYQETIKDSPPSSPGSERPLKPKVETNRQPGSCTAAPHMLGNELNPESGAAARLQEQLNAELAAHAAGQAPHPALVPPPLINKAGQSGGAGSSRGGSAQSLDQLLERQWEQGSQFLMEQAQHFDIASLLSCLHQLRTENVRLEEHVGNLLQRRDHLLAVNARLAIPLTTVSTGPAEQARCGRENGGQMRAPPPAVRDSLPAERPHQLMVRDVQQKPS